MPNWNEILNEVKSSGSVEDTVRRKYLTELNELTGRNIIIYYSGWLQRKDAGGIEISDEDKNGFMSVIHRLDRSKGLDLILHTPGGEIAATESLVDYLRAMFGTNIRAIVPQLAMSGGTMIACACKEIIMGKQSSIGPVDPHIRGIPTHGIIEEFQRAAEEIKEEPSKVHIWQPIIAKYHPTLIGECEKAIKWSNQMTEEWLNTGMFSDNKDAEKVIANIIRELGDHALDLSHSRHLSYQKCKDIGLKVTALEDEDALQEAVLSVHHSCMVTFSNTPAIKIIENHDGVAYIKLQQNLIITQR
ncbi:hypothetical protein QUF72_13580 [Desulfobacterales bacterium HSG2]|nr:hypothetical protein [Desulfobacterales bacterium HSG2]